MDVIRRESQRLGIPVETMRGEFAHDVKAEFNVLRYQMEEPDKPHKRLWADATSRVESRWGKHFKERGDSVPSHNTIEGLPPEEDSLPEWKALEVGFAMMEGDGEVIL